MMQIYVNNLFRGPRKIHKMMQVYVSNLQGPRNYRTEKILIEQKDYNYRTGSEFARNWVPEEYEGTVFYRTFVF